MTRAEAKNYLIDALLQISEKDAEIERLREENAHFAWRDKDKNKLIKSLLDGMNEPYAASLAGRELTRRAREATKNE